MPGTISNPSISQKTKMFKGEETCSQTLNREMKLRELQLCEYGKLLKQLKAKRDEFHLRYPDDPSDDISNAYGASCQLTNILIGYAEQYKHQRISLKQFKDNSSRVIQSKRHGVLGEHRGMKELLLNLLLAIGTLGIGYIVAAFFTQSLNPVKCNTNAVTLLDEIDHVLKKVGLAPTPLQGAVDL